MRVVALEEHFTVPELVKSIDPAVVKARGHMGEMLPVMLDRIDKVSALDVDYLKRPISKTILDQVWITTSGIFTEPPFLAALQTFGIDRIMFSVDYPYAPNMAGRSFLNRISLSPADMAKLCHGTADALLKLKA